MARCGVGVVAPGKAFLCPLPGHAEKKPSAALWKPDGGFYGLHDFHARGDGLWWPLPDVYAACMTRRNCKLGKGERAIWWLRALADIGAIDVPEVAHKKLPGSEPPSVRKLYAGFVLLLALRTVYDANQAQVTPFSWRFAQGWCDIGSPNTVKDALHWLFKHGFMHICGKTSQRTSLMALGKLPTIKASAPGVM